MQELNVRTVVQEINVGTVHAHIYSRSCFVFSALHSSDRNDAPFKSVSKTNANGNLSRSRSPTDLQIDLLQFLSAPQGADA